MNMCIFLIKGVITMKDVLIIGNGPAGLSAALYILRAGLSAAIIGKDDGSLAKAEKIENYFGLHMGLTGAELIGAGKKQVVGLGGELINDEVLSVSWDGHFTIDARSNQYQARAVIFATGSARKTPKIPGLSMMEGKGVSYCAVCDAFFYRGKEVAVLGNGEYALHEALELLPLVKSVTLLTNGKDLQAEFPEEILIRNAPISSLQGDPLLDEVQFSDGTVLKVSGLFVAIGSASAVDLARKVGALTEGNRIVVNENMETSVPGLFAAGDCIGGVLQVSVAVGEGAKAALGAIGFIRKQA